MTRPYFIGIDIGTQGARVVLMDSAGTIAASREETFPLSDRSREEQSPALWWAGCLRLLKSLLMETKGSISSADVCAISVTSTSGTVIPLDESMEPVHNAIMYSDKRSAEEGKMCRDMALRFHNEGYTGFKSSSGLSKIVWFGRHFPERAAKVAKWVHASDYITGRLSDTWGVTDYTNALKSGFDLKKGEWPEYLFSELNLAKEWFPKVVPSGTPVGNLASAVSDILGLPRSVKVVAGMTDGCASQVASGAVNLGDWNTTIGTTLVVKGVTTGELVDSQDRFYSHRHPEGFWMPGGASNTGADWITKQFNGELAGLNEQARRVIPTGHLAYPLQEEGERFPFIAPEARGFCPAGLSRAELFAANMEGVAYIERYAYELVEALSGEKVKSIFTAGGGSKSETWLSIRSSVLNLPIYKMKNISGAVGAAIVSASQTWFSSLREAAAAMTCIEREVLPQRELVGPYDENYRKFVEQLQQKGYIKENTAHA